MQQVIGVQIVIQTPLQRIRIDRVVCVVFSVTFVSRITLAGMIVILIGVIVILFFVLLRIRLLIVLQPQRIRFMARIERRVHRFRCGQFVVVIANERMGFHVNQPCHSCC